MVDTLCIDVIADDLTQIIDPKRIGSRRASNVKCGKASALIEEPMVESASILVIADDLAPVIYSKHIGSRGAGSVYFGEASAAVEEPVVTSVKVISHDLTPIIDPGGIGS